MRKRYKRKLRSCGLCKPHKRALERRFRPKEQARLERSEQEMLAARRTPAPRRAPSALLVRDSPGCT